MNNNLSLLSAFKLALNDSSNELSIAKGTHDVRQVNIIYQIKLKTGYNLELFSDILFREGYNAIKYKSLEEKISQEDYYELQSEFYEAYIKQSGTDLINIFGDKIIKQ